MLSNLTGRERVMLVLMVAFGLLALGLLRSLAIAEAPETVIRRYSKMWIESQDTWPYNRWVGVLTQQSPNDVWIIQEIISEVKPDFVIETGTYLGGSSVLWAMILEQVNPEGRVISIDIKHMRQPGEPPPIAAERVDYLIGSSTDPKLVQRIAERVRGKKVVVILDSDHSKDHVLAEMRAYGPLVPQGSYMIVQDSSINGHPSEPDFGPGPYEAIEEYLATSRDFEVDLTRERLMFTMHPRGYLKRVAPQPPVPRGT